MNESKILRIACDDKWYAHAYAEYLADVAENTSNLISAYQELLAIDDDGTTALDDDTISTKLRKYGIDPAARFCLPEVGAVSTKDIGKYLYNKTGDDGYTNEIFGVESTAEEVCQAIRGAWVQTSIASKAFSAYCEDAKSSIDRGTKFLQDLQGQFQLDDTVRDVYSMYQSLIASNDTVEGFLNHFLRMSGINQVADDDLADEFAYYNSDLYNYTGSTPALALDFSTVNKAVGTTVKVAAKVVKGIFRSISAGAVWLFNKAKKYVVDTVIEPAVAEFIGNDEINSGFLDGFAWFGEFVPNANYSKFASGAFVADIFSGFADSYADKWIKIKLRTGEFLFKFVQDDRWQAYFKPIAIDVANIERNFPSLRTPPRIDVNDPTTTINKYANWLKVLTGYIQPVGKDADKIDLQRGFACATALTESIAHAALFETHILVKGTVPDVGDNATEFGSGFQLSDFSRDRYVTAPTNKDIITAAAGDPGSVDNVHNHLLSTGRGLTDGLPRGSMQSIMTSIIASWALCRIERHNDPLNYTFVPFSNNHSGFTQPSWRVKSDNEIAATRDHFIRNAMTAAVVVTVAAVVGVAARKVATNAWFKRQRIVGSLENKMWNGGKLTAKEKRQYMRATKRQSASRLLSNGVHDSSAGLPNTAETIFSNVTKTLEKLTSTSESVNAVKGLVDNLGKDNISIKQSLTTNFSDVNQAINNNKTAVESLSTNLSNDNATLRQTISVNFGNVEAKFSDVTSAIEVIKQLIRGN